MARPIEATREKELGFKRIGYMNFTFLCPQELRDAIDSVSKQKGVSKSWLVRDILVERLLH